jgi:hypothetical protein
METPACKTAERAILRLAEYREPRSSRPSCGGVCNTFALYGRKLLGDWSRETALLEQMLEDASIKLSSVASTSTVSARAMLTAMIETDNPLQLANLAKGRMRQKECSAGRVAQPADEGGAGKGARG